MASVGIKPLGTRVLIKQVEIKEVKTDSGLVIPQTHEPSTHKAEVITVGEDVTKVKEGNLVLVSLYTGDVVEHNQETFAIIDEDSLLAVIDRS